MAQVRIETATNKRYIKKASSLEMTPYVYDETLHRYVLGDTTYDIYAIIGDTMEITHDAGDGVTKDYEFINSPLLQNVQRGDITFSADCLDLQNKVLKALFGVSFGMDSRGHEIMSAVPDDYPELYCCIKVSFHNDRLPDIVLPKVQINSQFIISQLKTNISTAKIKGVCFNHHVAALTDDTIFPFDADGGQYIPCVPMAFIEHGRDFAIGRFLDIETDDRTMTVYSDRRIICNQYTITAIPSDHTLGTTSGGGTYPTGSTITLSAYDVADDQGFHGHFKMWNDGPTTRSRQVTVLGDKTYVANFMRCYMLSITVTPEGAGTASASSGREVYRIVRGNTEITTYDETPFGVYVSVASTPASDEYYFVGWNDDASTVGPRIFVMNQDRSVGALFAKKPLLTITTTHADMLPEGAGRYMPGSEIVLTAPTDNLDRYRFQGWRIPGVSDLVTDNPYTFVMPNQDATIEAVYQGQVSVIATTNNSSMGTAEIFYTDDGGNTVSSGTNGNFWPGTPLHLSANPIPVQNETPVRSGGVSNPFPYGFRFRFWEGTDPLDFSSERDVVVSSNDVVYKALFGVAQKIVVKIKDAAFGSVEIECCGVTKTTDENNLEVFLFASEHDNVVITPHLNEGYVVSSVRLNNGSTSFTGNGPYRFSVTSAEEMDLIYEINISRASS